MSSEAELTVRAVLYVEIDRWDEVSQDGRTCESAGDGAGAGAGLLAGVGLPPPLLPPGLMGGRNGMPRRPHKLG